MNTLSCVLPNAYRKFCVHFPLLSKCCINSLRCTDHGDGSKVAVGEPNERHKHDRVDITVEHRVLSCLEFTKENERHEHHSENAGDK